MSPVEATVAMERNAIGLLSTCADVCPGATVGRSAGVNWYRTGLSHFFGNAVIDWNVPADQFDSFVADTLSEFGEERLPMLWYTGPSRICPEQAEAFSRAGIRKGSNSPGMTADLTQLTAESAIDVRPVDSEAMLVVWWQTLFPIFSMPEFMVPFFTMPYLEYGFESESPFKAFIAYIDDVPVGTSSLFVNQGVGGIYCVGTTESARGKGVGYAVTLAAMQETRIRGLDTAVLQSSPLGEPVYKRLGFVETCRFENWILSAPPRKPNARTVVGRRSSGRGRGRP